METTKLSLYQKLLVIQQRISGLGKDKKANSYSYVTGDKILGHVKPIMNELGLILKQEVLSIENVKIDYKTGIGTQFEKNKSEINSKVMMQFTWVDCETGEKDVNSFGANGQNDWDKGVGSALTYGERYFLLKFFHIATDEDDIDNDDRKPKTLADKIEEAKSILIVAVKDNFGSLWKTLTPEMQTNEEILAFGKEMSSKLGITKK